MAPTAIRRLPDARFRRRQTSTAASSERPGYDVVEMVLADREGWDRYESAKWLNMRRWLEENPDDDFAEEGRTHLSSEPTRYASYTREYVGWGVFALMAR